jgi:hypothetical protein
VVESGCGQWLEPRVEEQRVLPARRLARAFLARAQIVRDDRHELEAQRAAAGHAALAEHAHVRRVTVQDDIANSEGADLARPSGGSRQENGERELPFGPRGAGGRIRSGRRLDDLGELARLVDVPRKPCTNPRSSKARCDQRIGVQMALLSEITEQTREGPM